MAQFSLYVHNGGLKPHSLFYKGTVILLFLARFCKTLFLTEFVSNQLEILTQHSQSSQIFCYDFSKTSIMFFRIYLDPSTLERQKAVSA